MSDYNSGYARPTADMSVDAGLRGFMLGVYNKMGLGLLLAGALAWVVGNVTPVTVLMFNVVGDRVTGYSPLGLFVAFAPLGIILFSNFFMRRMTPATSGLLYWSIVSLIGASMGLLFLLYAGTMIFSALMVTAIAFGGLSLFGYATKRDLTGFGSFLIMGMWGIIAAGILTFFMPGLYNNPAFFFAYNVIGVLIFSGLIAWKTQSLKMMYYQLGGDAAGTAVATNIGALNLFISFINLFQFILALMGGRRN